MENVVDQPENGEINDIVDSVGKMEIDVHTEKSDTRNSSRVHESGTFPCLECDFVAKTKLGLSKHMVSKHNAPNKKDKKRERVFEEKLDKVESLEAQESDPKNGSSTKDAVVAPPKKQRVKRDEIDPQMWEEKEKIVRRLKALEFKFGNKVEWKCDLDIHTPLRVLQQEERLIMSMIAEKCGEQVCYDLILIGAQTLEAGTQHAMVKPYFNLAHYPSHVDANREDIMQCLSEIMAQYPDLGALMKPEMRLLMALGGAAVQCASHNKKREIVSK